MTRRATSRPSADLAGLRRRLFALLDHDPAAAVQQVRAIDVGSPVQTVLATIRASVLVDGGSLAHDAAAVDEGTQIFRTLHDASPSSVTAYNLANGLLAGAGFPPNTTAWLDHQERTRLNRAEARRLYWRAARDDAAPPEIRTQAWTNLANLFARSYRLGEAHDARLRALEIDPSNAIAADQAARDLMWLFRRGGCSDLVRAEAAALAAVAKRNPRRARRYAGKHAAESAAALADQLGAAPRSRPHEDPFIRWVEQERLTLAPTVELVDSAAGKLDWLMLPGVTERGLDAPPTTPPPIFAMFNVLKAEFILARELAWRSSAARDWPNTGRFALTSDYALYGPDVSALVLAHRTALDLLDKVAAAANHHFEIGEKTNRIFFGKFWRTGESKGVQGPLVPAIGSAIGVHAPALYGLAELAEDYESENGILRPHKDLRNAGTHRFIVLHDPSAGDADRPTPEIEHHAHPAFRDETLRALRVARSAIQMLALAIDQRERALQRNSDPGALAVPLEIPDDRRLDRQQDSIKDDNAP